MTVRDMIKSGIKFSGIAIVKDYEQSTGRLIRWAVLSRALEDNDGILDREVKEIYPGYFEPQHRNLIIEVGAKEGK